MSQNLPDWNRDFWYSVPKILFSEQFTYDLTYLRYIDININNTRIFAINENRFHEATRNFM